MEIRGNLNHGLTALTGISEAPAAASYVNAEPDSAMESSGPDGDWATLSATGSRISEALSGAAVREDKVAAIRSALASGAYMVSAQAVAARAIGAMLARNA